MFILLGITLISGTIFAINENYWATDPVMPFWLLKSNGIGIASLGQALVMLISTTAEFLIRTENASNKFVGINLLPVAVGCTVGAISSGRIIKRTGRYKVLSLVSLGVAAASYLIILLRWPRISSHWEMIYPFIAGIGIGGLLSTQFVALTISTPPKMSATAITIYNLSQQVGNMFGVTLTATVSRSLFERDLGHKFGNYPDAIEVSNVDSILLKLKIF
ncbi:transporter [Penicillium taxi]|uniref:transporter n=1 Tax=Penicillium taxi TaxID=168475 RepID=UPI00254566FF|nr:transporter [Penicillium taxi]KAJ5895364.1 transporter [Penicillium taxi]